MTDINFPKLVSLLQKFFNQRPIKILHIEHCEYDERVEIKFLVDIKKKKT